MDKVVVHGFTAHVDDFLACCIILSKYPDIVLERRSFTEEDLRDKNTFVVDHGKEYNLECNNFDHHQFFGPPCAFTLLLEHFLGKEKYDSFKKLFRWCEVVENYDCCGPQGIKDFLNIDIDHEYFINPIENFMVEEFSKVKILEDGCLRRIMTGIGDSIFSNFSQLNNQIKSISKKHKIINFDDLVVMDLTLLNSNKNLSFVFKKWNEIYNLNINLLFYNDVRSGGYRLQKVDGIDHKITFKENSELYETLFVHSDNFLMVFKNKEDLENIINYCKEKES